ncbi:MAG TPA: GTP cyclohydrolase II RibA [Candidatus Eisenbacteria bacterium]|nr:GTP cyclohydrolase II RibA [Candidatus Eisenbacteria bacterium]
MSLGRDGMLVATGGETIATRHGDFVVHAFHNCTTGQPALAVTHGDLHAHGPLLARVHSSCITSEVYGACDCDCAEQLDAALAHIAARGRGALFYLMQEGRGAGFIAKALDRMLVQASRNRLSTFDAYAKLGLPDDQRSYGEVAAMVRLLGIAAPLRLLSNNPDKVAALRAAGALVDGTEPIRIDASAYSQHYLHAKSRAGHTLARTDGIDPATLPEPVTVASPEALPATPRFVHVASYLLPVRAGAAAWFRLHAYVDTATRRERVVLIHGSGGDDVLVRVQRETLLDRFPLCEPRFRRRWDAVVERIAAHGRAVVVFADADEDVRELAGALVRAHLDRRRAMPLFWPDEADDERALCAGIAP